METSLTHQTGQKMGSYVGFDLISLIGNWPNNEGFTPRELQAFASLT
jgi:hypothetical protein